MKMHKVICPYCKKEVEVFGNGFYGTYDCPYCSDYENGEGNWFNLFGQAVIPPQEQVLCEDW